MLEGKNVNLRIVEKEDLQLYVKWVNDPTSLENIILLNKQRG